jgi:hypothetical protein
MITDQPVGTSAGTQTAFQCVFDPHADGVQIDIGGAHDNDLVVGNYFMDVNAQMLLSSGGTPIWNCCFRKNRGCLPQAGNNFNNSTNQNATQPAGFFHHFMFDHNMFPNQNVVLKMDEPNGSGFDADCSIRRNVFVSINQPPASGASTAMLATIDRNHFFYPSIFPLSGANVGTNSNGSTPLIAFRGLEGPMTVADLTPVPKLPF